MTASGSDGEGLAPSAYMVLALIRDGIDTGYAIKKYLELAASFFWSASYGQIYPELQRLEDAGMISGRDATVDGRRRREYRLLRSGRTELDRWLRSQPPSLSAWIRNEGVLRLMLVDWEADPELVIEKLAELRDASRRRLADLDALGPPRERGRRIRELGMRIHRETIAWCDETERALGADRPG